MTKKEIEDIIAQAEEGKKIKIHGYESSRGGKTTYTGSLVGVAGYKDLVKQSLKKLEKLEYKDAKVDFDEVTFNTAKEELITSFNKTINGEHTARKFNTAKEPDPEVVIIRHFLCDTKEVIEKPKPPTTKRRSSDKVLCKNALRSKLPIANYIGQLNLSEKKCEKIETTK